MGIRLAEPPQERILIPADPPERIRLNQPSRPWWKSLLLILGL
jgi:hypothetical protein